MVGISPKSHKRLTKSKMNSNRNAPTSNNDHLHLSFDIYTNGINLTTGNNVGWKYTHPTDSIDERMVDENDQSDALDNPTFFPKITSVINPSLIYNMKSTNASMNNDFKDPNSREDILQHAPLHYGHDNEHDMHYLLDKSSKPIFKPSARTHPESKTFVSSPRWTPSQKRKKINFHSKHLTSSIREAHSEIYTVHIDTQISEVFRHKRVIVRILEFMEIEEWILSVYGVNKSWTHLVESLMKSKHSLFEKHWITWNKLNNSILQNGLCWFSPDSLPHYRFRWRQICYIEQYLLPYHLVPYIESKMEGSESETLHEGWMELLRQTYSMKFQYPVFHHFWRVYKESWEHLHVCYSGELFGIDVDVLISRRDYSFQVNIEGLPNDLSFVKAI